VGEKQNGPFQLSFNASLKIDFQGSRVTSDGGLVLVRKLDERLGFGELIAQHRTDSRKGKNTELPLADLLRQSVHSRMAGYEDVNDAERLSQDPTFRLIGSEKTWDRGAALTSRLQTFETEMLAEEENFAGLARINRELIGEAEALDSPQRVVLNMDSTEIPVYGQQEQSAYNGHFESTCYHPLVLFNREGDCLAAKLRPGNVHSAADLEELLLPEIERQQKLGKEVVFRARPRGRPGFRQAGDLRSPGGASCEVCHPYSIQRKSGAGHRGIVDAASGKAGPQAGGLVQGFSLPGGQLEDGTAGRGQGGVSFWGVVPSRGIHRHEPGERQPASGAVLQQAGDGGTMDQRRQGVPFGPGEDHAAELPPVPFQRSAALAERARVQPGEPVAAAGAAEEDRELVADESTAAVGKDWRPVGQARAVLLAAAGREPSDQAIFRGDGGKDRSLAGRDRVAGKTMAPAKSGSTRTWGVGDVLVEITEKKQLSSVGFLRRGGIGAWPSQKGGFRRKSTNTLNFGGSEVAAL